ncbi:unnamed protein product [Macrosiphum euphorbiae]|uniref:Secreted protein n=1 Tax=Macrosiphum euphorbiae TaxID=13131 RepID=A0AAV0X2B0_9HEMI|nr:unnamed protein product [Macrosiphum euphorbiae]
MGHTTTAVPPGPVASAATGIILHYIILWPQGPVCRSGAALDCLAIREHRTGKESISALVSQSYTYTHIRRRRYACVRVWFLLFILLLLH